MTNDQYINELIGILKRKVNKYINRSVIECNIKHEQTPTSDYLKFIFTVFFYTTDCTFRTRFKIDNNIDLVFKNNTADEYTDAILKQAINYLMEKLKIFIFYRK